jgi:hypothetical protein
MVAHDPAAAPLSPTVRLTEDAAPLKVGEGIWKSEIKFSSYRLDFIDTREGTAALHAVLEEKGTPIRSQAESMGLKSS